MRRLSTQVLVTRVRKEFPEISFSAVRRARTGIDHDVLFLDERLAFRFPRNRAYKKTLTMEMYLLDELAKTQLPFAVPQYRFVARSKAFGGYNFIPGEKLTREAFKRLSGARKRRFAREVGVFLTALHALPTRGMLEDDPREPRTAVYRERYQKKRRVVIKRAISAQLLRRIDDFFETTYRSITLAPVKTIIHSDLRDEHILMSAGRIAGIIDFGDVVLGDPAFDFTCLWDLGDEMVNTVYQNYKGPKDDMFLCRSRIHYLRWVVDELFHAVRKNNKALIARRISVLEANLPVLCVIT